LIAKIALIIPLIFIDSCNNWPNRLMCNLANVNFFISFLSDLSTVTTGSDKDEVNMDMNKENKSPDSSVTASSYKGTKDTLSASGTEEDELEDGEIVSESE